MGSITPLTYNSPENYTRITSFAGIAQSGDGENLNINYAVAGSNFDTSDGSLKPYHTGTKLPGDLSAPIGTLAPLYRRYGTFVDPILLIASAGGKLYARVRSSEAWEEIYSGLALDTFDYVAYEVNLWDGVQLENPVDVLLITNEVDGMFCIRGDTLEVAPVPTPKKFGVLTRHSERIWGSGILNDPDMLVYSAPYDPFDWTQNDEIPEDGAGDIIQPSWDGDSFVALRPFGSQLIALKTKKVWRIIGTDPGTYVMKEQYGGGTVVENTVAVADDYMLMLGENSLMIYDGSSVSQFQPTAIQKIIRRINAPYRHKATAIMHDNKYYLAMPLDGSTINNSVLIFNVNEKTFNLIEGISVSTFAEVGNELLYTSDETPSSIWTMTGGAALPVFWCSSWQDELIKNASKTGFELLLTTENEAELTLGIRTERKLKEKTVLLRPGMVKRVRVSNKGKRWRLELHTESGQDFRIIGGILIMMEMDYD